MQIFKDIIVHLISAFTILNVVLYIYGWANDKSNKLVQFLTLYTISLFVTHFTMMYISKMSVNPNNLFIAHYHFVFQFLLLGLFYRRLFTKSQKKWVTAILILVLTSLALYYITNPEKYWEFNVVDIFSTTVPLIFFSIGHLYNMLTSARRFFIFNAGVLIYLSTSALIFFLGTLWNNEKDFVAIDSQTTDNIWFISQLIYFVYLIFITIEWKTTIYKWKVNNK